MFGFRRAALATLSFTAPSLLLAAQVGTVSLVNQGEDVIYTPVGVTGAVQVGNNEESGETMQDLVGQGGNAITVNMSDELAGLAAQFRITSTGCANSGDNGLQVVNLNSSTAFGICSQIHAGINQGCSWRGGGTMDIVVPFLCSVSDWRFLTGVVPARPSIVTVSGITEGEAAIVDRFRLTYNSGTTISGDAPAFAGVSSGSQLASAISGLSGLINATYSSGNLTITTTNTGPISLTNIRVDVTTPPTTTVARISGLTDQQAAAVNRFTLNIDGAPVSQPTVSFSAVSSVGQLASELNEIQGISVSNPSAGTLDIAAAAPGARVFTATRVAVLPVITTSAGSADFTENGSEVTIDPGLDVSFGLGGNLASGSVTFSPFLAAMDQILFTPSGGVAGSVNAGTLSLTGAATATAYRDVLRSVRFVSTQDDPPTSINVSFSLFDGSDSSESAGRTINVTTVNDRPTVMLTGSTLINNEGSSSAVDPDLTVEDLDNSNLASATVSIVGAFQANEDQLEFSNQSGISGSYANGVMTLTGPATVANFQSALRNVRYRNLSDTPDETVRTVQFIVSDGFDPSVAGFRMVAVNPVNDAPTLTASPGTLEYPTGQALTIDAGIVADDPDSPTLVGATVRIINGFVEGEDVLIFVDDRGITGNYDGIAGELTLSGEATPEDYLEVLRTIAFLHLGLYPAGQRIISFQLDDGDRLSSSRTRTLIMPQFIDGFETRP